MNAIFLKFIISVSVIVIAPNKFSYDVDFYRQLWHES